MSQKNDMMTCDDYQEALTVNPAFEDESGHLDSCESCQAYRAEMLAFDENLAAAMDIDVPELILPDLPELETENVTALGSRRNISTPAWFALAASVLLAAIIGFQMTGVDESYIDLQRQVLAHVDNEPGALRVSSVPVSDNRLARTVPDNIATMNHDAGLITYAQSCSINGRSVPHLVIQGEHGPITILLMPFEEVSKAIELDGVNIQGVILPVGNGSIAIIGGREEQLDRVKQNVVDAVTWST